MVEILDLTILTDKRRLFEQMKTKAIGCGTPLDWKLREPVEAHRTIYLRPKETGKKKGQYASVRRVLFYLEYGMLPLKNIVMVCGVSSCVNPSHARMIGFESELNESIEDQIERGILYSDDAEKWFGWENPKKAKLSEKHEGVIDSLSS